MRILTLLLFITIFSCHLLSGQSFVDTKLVKGQGRNGESYTAVAFDGAWCWFSDPRAVYFEGKFKRTYIGWIDSYGNIVIAYFDHVTSEIKSKVLYADLEIDDHDNPAILFDATGRLLVFFNKHLADKFYSVKSKNAEDITEWEEVKELDLNNKAKYPSYKSLYTYTNPVSLSAENNKIYLFWRGHDHKPTMATSTDQGVTWQERDIFIMPERNYDFKRPYMKVYSKGKDKIHFAFTDGHPRNEPLNNLYYMYYQNGAFYKANGQRIKSLADVPVRTEEVDKVFDAASGSAKAWVWDVAEDDKGQPIIAYTKFPNDSTHIYTYARWDGAKWTSSDLVNSGSWFPKTPAGKVEPEPNYSGGISIDHENPSTLYLSVKRDSVFEIEKWTTSGPGKKWKVEAITSGSSKDNIRPFAVRGANKDNPLQLLWMCNSNYIHYTNYLSSIRLGITPSQAIPATDSASVMHIMKKVADWQISNPSKSSPIDWIYGAFYSGLSALYKSSGDDRYLTELMNVGKKYKWSLMDDVFHADRLTIAQTYTELYMLKKQPEMIAKAKWAMDIHIGRGTKPDVRFKNNEYFLEWWSWCDALYMAPPAFAEMSAVTKDPKYLAYADKYWWITSDYLYSKQDSLIFRDDRFFTQQSKNGKKVFWARGNGWVIAGLARMLNYMPKDYPSRPKFEQQFREMAAKLLSLQDKDGLWRLSLLDPQELNLGESSGSAFYTYAFAWGINNGLLDANTYAPAVKKAWIALCKNVNDQGRLGYVQQVAGSPFPFQANQSHLYASGAFLLAGCEMLKLKD